MLEIGVGLIEQQFAELGRRKPTCPCAIFRVCCMYNPRRQSPVAHGDNHIFAHAKKRNSGFIREYSIGVAFFFLKNTHYFIVGLA